MTGARPPAAGGAAGSRPSDAADRGLGSLAGHDYGYEYGREHDRAYGYEYGYEYAYEPGYERERGRGYVPEPTSDSDDARGGTEGDSDAAQWYDDEAGPLVRLYALTRGRARSDARVFNLLALVIAESGPYDDPTLSPEQVRVLELCCRAPQSVAEIAAGCDLPLGVARVLLGDLLEIGHVRVRQPKPPAALFDEHILQEVINGLRAL
ncbi:MAG TPA: DUF742 domain-containing protein [Actinocrinis sp.]|nr:DUF742 domain-containing protein [Actinocrinis sp.]